MQAPSGPRSREASQERSFAAQGDSDAGEQTEYEIEPVGDVQEGDEEQVEVRRYFNKLLCFSMNNVYVERVLYNLS